MTQVNPYEGGGGYYWIPLLAHHSDEGRQWVDELQERTGGESVDDALQALRRGDVAEGGALLRRFETLIEDDPEERDSVDHALHRWFLAALGYYHYCRGENHRAVGCLRQAEEAVAWAVAEDDFLRPLAYDCLDFSGNIARVERRRRDWSAMAEEVRRARRMVEGEEPFVRLPDGTGIGIRELQDYYRAMDLSDDEKEAVSFLFDDTHRRRQFDRFIGGMYLLKGFVVSHV